MKLTTPKYTLEGTPEEIAEFLRRETGLTPPFGSSSTYDPAYISGTYTGPLPACSGEAIKRECSRVAELKRSQPLQQCCSCISGCKSAECDKL